MRAWHRMSKSFAATANAAALANRRRRKNLVENIMTASLCLRMCVVLCTGFSYFPAQYINTSSLYALHSVGPSCVLQCASRRDRPVCASVACSFVPARTRVPGFVPLPIPPARYRACTLVDSLAGGPLRARQAAIPGKAYRPASLQQQCRRSPAAAPFWWLLAVSHGPTAAPEAKAAWHAVRAWACDSTSSSGWPVPAAMATAGHMGNRAAAASVRGPFRRPCMQLGPVPRPGHITSSNPARQRRPCPRSRTPTA